jgi:hypothetical protein
MATLSVDIPFHNDPSIPDGFDEEEEGMAPSHARVGANSNIRTQMWTAGCGNFTRWPGVLDDFICCESGIAVDRHRGVVALTDMSNAFMRGKTCRKYRIKSPDVNCRAGGVDPAKRPVGLILEIGSVKEAFDWLEEQDDEDFESGGYSECIDYTPGSTRFRIYRSSTKGVRTFSAAHLDQITALSSIPKSWNVRRAMRAILAGQVEEWFVDGIYTDDYARDAAHDYHRGELENYLGKAKRIWENPSGWQVWTSNVEDADRRDLSFNCHTFDTNSVRVDLDAEAVDRDWLTCLRKHGEHPADHFGA